MLDFISWNKLKRLPEYSLFGLDKATVVSFKGKNIEQNHIYSHPNFRFRSEIIRGRNWACAGDSAIFLDPLLSHGVTLAISFGSQLGEISSLITEKKMDPVDLLIAYENKYFKQIEVINKIIGQWYQPNFEINEDWQKSANKISNIFGRPIGDDIDSFRWISNLENMQLILKENNNTNLLKLLEDVNTIKMIHEFEKKL